MLKKIMILSLIGYSAFGVTNDLNHENTFDQFVGWLAQSKVTGFYKKQFYVPMSNLYHWMLNLKFDDAAKDYQELGKKYQRKMGIPEDKLLPIKKLPEKYATRYRAAGMALSQYICVNENIINQNSTAAQVTLLHEAVHAKYEDQMLSATAAYITAYIIGGTTQFIAAALLTSKIPWVSKKTENGIITCGALIAGLGATKLLISKYRRYFERRADIKAFNAVDCATCLDNFKVHFRNYDLSKDGYLKPSEVDKIIENLEKANKFCDSHDPLSLHAPIKCDVR